MNSTTDIVALFRRLTTGVYIVGVADCQRRDAFTAASVMQVSYQPLLLALAINPVHASYPLLCEGRAFTVSVLADDQLALAQHFGTRQTTDKLRGFNWRYGRTGAPILETALAFFDCMLVDNIEAGDHHLVLGRVTDGAIFRTDAEALHYTDTHDIDCSSTLFPPIFAASIEY